MIVGKKTCWRRRIIKNVEQYRNVEFSFLPIYFYMQKNRGFEGQNLGLG